MLNVVKYTMNSKLSFVIVAAIVMAFAATGLVSVTESAFAQTNGNNNQTNSQGTHNFNNQQDQSTFSPLGFNCC